MTRVREENHHTTPASRMELEQTCIMRSLKKIEKECKILLGSCSCSPNIELSILKMVKHREHVCSFWSLIFRQIAALIDGPRWRPPPPQ